MQAYRLNLTFIAILVCFCPFAVRANVTDLVKKEIEAVYSKRNGAAQKKDLKGMLATYSPDYVILRKNGEKGNLKEVKDRLAPVFALTKKLVLKTKPQKWTNKGKTVVVQTKDHIELVMVNPETEKTNTLVADSLVEDTWKKTAKGWLQVSSKSLDEIVTLDGKPLTGNLGLGSGSNGNKPSDSSSKPKPQRLKD